MKPLAAILTSALLSLAVTSCASGRPVGDPNYQGPPVAESFLGFVGTEPGRFSFGVQWTFSKPITQPLYIVALLENPADPSAPFRLTQDLVTGARELRISTGEVTGFVEGRAYRATVSIYSDSARTVEVGHYDSAVVFRVFKPAYQRSQHE